MAYYNKRDMIGHWVKPKSAAGKMCPHACCRNYRVHPDRMPVVMPNKLLRSASDDQLAEHFVRVSKGDASTEKEREAYWQLLFEMERRDEQAKKRSAAQSYRAARAANRKNERELAVHSAWLEAERATNGYMLNKRGRAEDIDALTLFTGTEAHARKYASDELLEHWRTHPRPATVAQFSGGRARDMRVSEAASSSSARERRPRRHYEYDRGDIKRPRTVRTGRGRNARTVSVRVVKRAS